MACTYCGYAVAYSNLKEHHAICPDCPVPCSNNCDDSLSLTRKNLPAHMAQCPRALVPCTMANYGCTEQVERCQLEQHLQTCVPRHMGKMCQEMDTLKEQVQELKALVATQKETIEKMETNVYPCTGQFTWRIDDIRKKIMLAQSGDQNASVIYSPAFYSLEAGYKLSLCIYPAGDNNQGFLSLYFVVLKGRYDEILQWPFQKRVYLSLLNTRYFGLIALEVIVKVYTLFRGGQSITKDIHPDPRLHYFHRPENPRNVGYGYPKFIALSILQAPESEFVQNGAIFLRCRIFN